MRRGIVLAIAAIATAGMPTGSAAAAEPAPPRLSKDQRSAQLATTHGSGNLGRWGVDELGMPRFSYEVDHTTDPRAAQRELAGGRLAQHQVGNDYLMANAYNEGFTQLWSQARLFQWANRHDPATRQYGGGFGWLRVGDEIISTLYPDRPKDAAFDREFGVGYFRKRVRAHGIEIVQDTIAPFGHEPLLVDEVTITNTTDRPRSATWFEYWGINPYNQTSGSQGTIGFERPVWDARTRTLTVRQRTQGEGDRRPHSIFAAALSGSFEGFETSIAAFFGQGDRARPAAVVADRLTGSIARARSGGDAGDALAAFRAPLRLDPGETVRLRYAFGLARPQDIPAIVARHRAQQDTFTASGRRWARWLPRADFGRERRWVARELAWDAYLLRSATHYEEACGHHTITQGGYYQYDSGQNMGYRSWLHYLLPMVYTEPEIAREILRYSLRLQPPPPTAAQINPYGTGPLCTRYDLGTSSDFDFWLLLAAGEYGLGARDPGFFDDVIPYGGRSGKRATAWQHLKEAFAHTESELGPNGGYFVGTMGDWTDFTPITVVITESLLVTAQLAYAYPKLAEVADLRGDRDFAQRLRAAAARNVETMRRNWTPRGWFARGYLAAAQRGTGVLFSEPQSWAILAGAPDAQQSSRLVANIRRFLTGHGAPGGPSKIGSAQSPAGADPDVTERGHTNTLLGRMPQEALEHWPSLGNVIEQRARAAVWPGNVWYDLNGHLTWSLTTLDGVVPDARALAWDEYTRNTLAAHATAFPDHWAGTISVDDVCNAYYAYEPDRCGGFSERYDGQITEQPTWMVMNAIRLAGVTPTRAGYDIAPHLPFSRFSLRMPRIGVAREAGRLRGYVRPDGDAPVELSVRLPDGVPGARVRVWAEGRRVGHELDGATVRFALPRKPGRTTDWAVSWRSPSASRRARSGARGR